MGLSPARGFAEATAGWSGAHGACLADACALIVFHGFGGAGMSEAGLTAMRGGQVLVSPVTVWEIVRKAGDGKLPGSGRTAPSSPCCGRPATARST